MKNSKFYVTNSNNGLIYGVDIKNIDQLSVIATSCKGIDNFSKVNAHLKGLEEYLVNNSNELLESYVILVSSEEGKDIIYRRTELQMFENCFREYGIDDSIVNIYNSRALEYRDKLLENSVKYCEKTGKVMYR